jgi:hypothetical protein
MSLHIILFISEDLIVVVNKWDLERAFPWNKYLKPIRTKKSEQVTQRAECCKTSLNMKVVVRIRPQNAKELGNNTRYVYYHISDLMRWFCFGYCPPSNFQCSTVLCIGAEVHTGF